MRNFLLFFMLIFFYGCSSVEPQISMKPPIYVEELPSKENSTLGSNQGSLFGRGDSPLFADRKAMNVNDIVTVLIKENTKQSIKANRSTQKDTSLSLKGGAFANIDGVPFGSALSKANQLAGIGFSAGGSNEFSGTGSNSRNEAFSTTISARIIKILNNGNYFIEGSKELLINGEKQIIQISGVIRPDDITQRNQIDSKYIADAKILYKTQGDIDVATKKPWGSRLLEVIWPF